jgi:predicted enzyme related to lactoylglutathione lyase
VDGSHPDPDAVRPFYRAVFGWEFEDAMPPEAGGNYFMARVNGGDAAAIGSNPPGAPPVARWNTYIWVDDVDDAVSKAKDAGGTVAMEPFDVMDAGRMAVIVDPEGATFCVWQPKAHKGASVVNEHGALNFNNLATRDPEAAEAFYGAVFGWKILRLPSGMVWTLSSYGDHLEERSPGLRSQMAQMGAPEGFIDVVAALDPIKDDDTDTPAHWSVTFGVDDVEAAASRARELGGEVIRGPVDVPWSRQAVIRDPQGATFIASQFVFENKDLKA